VGYLQRFKTHQRSLCALLQKSTDSRYWPDSQMRLTSARSSSHTVTLLHTSQASLWSFPAALLQTTSAANLPDNTEHFMLLSYFWIAKSPAIAKLSIVLSWLVLNLHLPGGSIDALRSMIHITEPFLITAPTPSGAPALILRGKKRKLINLPRPAHSTSGYFTDSKLAHRYCLLRFVSK